MKWKLRPGGWHSAAKFWFLTGKHCCTQLFRRSRDSNCFDSGIFLLQQHLWERLNVRSTQEAQQHTFMETRSAIDTLCRIALELQQGSNMVDPLQGQCTFFLVGVVYQGLLALMTIGQGNPSAEISETITTLSWLLEHIRGRWPLAGKLLWSVTKKELSKKSMSNINRRCLQKHFRRQRGHFGCRGDLTTRRTLCQEITYIRY